MYLKGQSALENLITYGWMLVAISVIGGVIYGNNLGNSCELGVDSPYGTAPVVSDIGRSTDGRIALELRNPQENDITIDELRFKQNEELRTSVNLDKTIRGKSESGYKTTNFQNSPNCNTYNLEVEYSSGTISNLLSEATIRGKISIVRLLAKFNVEPTVAEKGQTIEFNASPSETSNTIKEYSWNFSEGGTATGKTATESWSSEGAYTVELTVTDNKGNTATKTKTVYVGGIIFTEGGGIDTLGINSTLATNCIGNECSNVTGGREERVHTGGDTIEGTLLVNNIQEQEGEICLTSNQSLGTDNGCPETSISDPNNTLTDLNNVMWGSLEAPVLKPLDSDICIGEC